MPHIDKKRYLWVFFLESGIRAESVNENKLTEMLMGQTNNHDIFHTLCGLYPIISSISLYSCSTPTGEKRKNVYSSAVDSNGIHCIKHKMMIFTVYREKKCPYLIHFTFLQ